MERINIELIAAVVNGDVECVKVLLDEGADVNYRNQKGFIVNIQIQKMDAWRNRRGYTPLMYAAEARMENCVKFLVNAGADVNMCNHEGDTAIIAASKGGNIKVIKFLLESGADVNAVGTLGNTALMEAARNGNEDCVKLLCDSGANVNRIDKGSYSALLLAAVYGHHKNIEVLTSAGACVNTRELRGKTALTIATESYREKCVKALVDADADGSHLLVEAVESGCVKRVKLLLGAGVRVNTDGTLLDSFTLCQKGQKWQDKTMVLLLFASGGVTEDHAILADNYLQQELTDISLKHFCRRTIRNHMLKLNSRLNLFVRVPEIGLPQSLASYLLFGVSIDN